MKKVIFISIIASVFMSCNSKIKDADAIIEVEKGTEVIHQNDVTEPALVAKKQQVKEPENESADTTNIIGSWVGYFKEDAPTYNASKYIYADEGFIWNRENKINLSIDQIRDSIVIGHSVVAGNNRLFKGRVKNGVFQVNESGDDQYDGQFVFSISDSLLTGIWEAYRDIEIPKRKYELKKMSFRYQPDIMLEQTKEYVDWNNFTEETERMEYEEGVFEDWITKEFASATDRIYSINASNTLLQKEDVENLKKGDLTIIRNTIYARHGYSFKKRPLRVFFDAQSWYIPIHSDITADFTDIEKENIKLLLRYEKNAAEYYDYFGRG